MKKTLVLGASPNPARYSNRAVWKLGAFGHPVFAYGVRKGEIGDVEISDKWPEENFHTVTLYLNPERQKEFYQRLIEMNPKRVIFNPGTENPELQQMLEDNGIEVEVACTLVMLSVGTY